MACITTAKAEDETIFMDPATLVFPTNLSVSEAPSIVDVSYGNQPIELIDPQTNDWDDEYVAAYVKLDDGEQQEISAGLLVSYGDPDNEEDEDLYNLEFALYELDDLFDFNGKTVTLIIPEGIVKNAEGAINPAQEIVFTLVETYTDWTLSPESGSTLTDDFVVKVSFGGNPIEYAEGEVTLYHYEPSYEQLSLEYGKEVSISEENDLLIDLSGLEDDFYEVVIPEGFVTVTEGEKNSINPSLWLEYTIERSEEDGIATTLGEEGPKTIHTIQGLRVKEATRGIYVIDGKKVIITRK